MTVIEGALVRLGDCTKGSPYTPAAIPILLNGVIYPNFGTITAGGLESEIHKNGPDGTAITSVTATVASAPLATINPPSITQGNTATLDCERLWWSVRAIDGSGFKTPLCYGWIQVRPK